MTVINPKETNKAIFRVLTGIFLNKHNDIELEIKKNNECKNTTKHIPLNITKYTKASIPLALIENRKTKTLIDKTIETDKYIKSILMSNFIFVNLASLSIMEINNILIRNNDVAPNIIGKVSLP